MVGKDGVLRSLSRYFCKQYIIILKRVQMMAVFKHGLDKFLDKVISRKLLVWITATGLLAFSDLQSSDWVLISAIYIGGQTVVDIVSKLKSNV
jgi:hypothetical protein